MLIKLTNAYTGRPVVFENKRIVMVEEVDGERTKIVIDAGDGTIDFYVKERIGSLIKPSRGEQDD